MEGHVFRLLGREEIESILRELAQRPFANGRASAPTVAEGVKHNLEAKRSGAGPNPADEIVFDALKRNRDLQKYVLTKRFVMPLYSRYEPGMKYGDHIDSAIMGGMHAVRTDFAVTIFLSAPSSYDGGELAVAGGEEVKLDAGEAFVYPANTIHHVTPVTRGVRLAAITWLQSSIRDEALRGLLFDVAIASEQAKALDNGEHNLQLSKIYNNLIRYAAEP